MHRLVEFYFDGLLIFYDVVPLAVTVDAFPHHLNQNPAHRNRRNLDRTVFVGLEGHLRQLIFVQKSSGFVEADVNAGTRHRLAVKIRHYDAQARRIRIVISRVRRSAGLAARLFGVARAVARTIGRPTARVIAGITAGGSAGSAGLRRTNRSAEQSHCPKYDDRKGPTEMAGDPGHSHHLPCCTPFCAGAQAPKQSIKSLRARRVAVLLNNPYRFLALAGIPAV